MHTGKEPIEMTERAEQAQRLHDKGYNCAQAVVCAYCDQFGLDKETAYKMAEGFGLGMGLMEVCGALSGAAMAAGILVGETDADAKNRFAAEFRRQVVEPFARKHGSMACGDMVNDKKMLMECADFSAATKEQFEARPCLSLVLSACELTENFVKGFNNK